MNPPVKIICVLKSGGCYTPDYVDKLFNSIHRNSTISFKFICLSDLAWDSDYSVHPLTENFPGWWSKIEMFKYNGPVVTMDLDTLIIRNIDKLLCLPLYKSDDDDRIYMMKAANIKRTYTTSIMAWNGNFKYIFDNFIFDRDKDYKWDQYYILSELKQKWITEIQCLVSGIYSYKRQWEKQDDTRIIWFHGHPRMHNCNEEILKEHWK